MKNSVDLEGHRALVNYNYGLGDLCMALAGTVLYMFAVFGSIAMMGCATQEEVGDWGTEEVERSRGLSEYHWSEDYIEDHCEACPDCCVDELWDAGEGDDSE